MPLEKLLIGSLGCLAGIAGGVLLARWNRKQGMTEPADGPHPAHTSSPLLPAESAEPDAAFLPMLLGIVDAIDEIELMKTRAASAEHSGLSAVQDRLSDLVELSGGELIRGTSWQPSLQRAVKVEPAEPGQTDVRYLQTRATGLKHTGRIIRKQEVIISQPKP